MEGAEVFQARTEVIVRTALALSQARSGAERPWREVRISLGVAGDGHFNTRLSLANGGPDLAIAVARREIDLAEVNPAGLIGLAIKGSPPFDQPAPLRLIGVLPSWDRMGFAIADRTGLSSIEDLVARRYPLRLSLRRSSSHASRRLIDEVLDAVGARLDDLPAWGGSLHFVDLPNDPLRLDGIRAGDVDAVFDEGVDRWGSLALQHGMNLLSLQGKPLHRLEALGWPVALVPRDRIPGLRREVLAPSFSGFALVVHAELAEDTAYQLCVALESALPTVSWKHGAIDLRELCSDSDEAPLTAPLHPGAERFYLERGLR